MAHECIPYSSGLGICRWTVLHRDHSIRLNYGHYLQCFLPPSSSGTDCVQFHVAELQDKAPACLPCN